LKERREVSVTARVRELVTFLSLCQWLLTASVDVLRRPRSRHRAMKHRRLALRESCPLLPGRRERRPRRHLGLHPWLPTAFQQWNGMRVVLRPNSLANVVSIRQPPASIHLCSQCRRVRGGVLRGRCEMYNVAVLRRFHNVLRCRARRVLHRGYICCGLSLAKRWMRRRGVLGGWVQVGCISIGCLP